MIYDIKKIMNMIQQIEFLNSLKDRFIECDANGKELKKVVKKTKKDGK